MLGRLSSLDILKASQTHSQAFPQGRRSALPLVPRRAPLCRPIRATQEQQQEQQQQEQQQEQVPLGVAWASSDQVSLAVTGQEKKDPFAEQTVYNDNFIDLFILNILTRELAIQQGGGVYVPDRPTYDDFVRVSKEIMKGRTADQQKTVILKTLKSLMPGFLITVYRGLFRPAKWSAELNAFMAPLMFFWLVGDMERQRGDIKISPTEVRSQNSIVKIKKCRYLEASGCVGACNNFCKVPTQDFFMNDMGMPLTMKPNFEDLSCEMIFGQAPEPRETDEAFKQPCFVNNCDIAKERALGGGGPCPKMSRS